MSVPITITNAGRAAMVNAQHTGTASVAIAAIGLSATAVTPDPAATSLPGEFKRVATVGGQMVAADMIHVTMTDSSGDAYSANAFAIYLADGTLFALYGQATTILTKTAATLGLLAVDIQLADSSAATIAFGDTSFLNPPASETVQGVVELATVAEAQAGIDALRALTPAGARAAVMGYLLAQDGAGSGLDADLLDGQQGSYYADVPARLGFNPVQQGGGAGQLNNTVYLGWSNAARLKLQVDSTDLGYLVTDADAASGNVAFNSGVMRRFNMDLWGPDNDGAGSGLDADRLDGQDSSYFTNIPARLGYSPANKAGDTFTGDLSATGTNGSITLRSTAHAKFGRWVMQSDGNFALYRNDDGGGDVAVAWLTSATGPFNFNVAVTRSNNTVWDAGNDGAGSGLDADLLDGQDSSFFTDIRSRLGFTPVQQGTGIGQLSNSVKIGWSNDYRVKCTVDNTDMGGLVTDAIAAQGSLVFNGNAMRRNGNDLWGPDNDGSGSGLDADLLDGMDSTAFARTDGSTLFTGSIRCASTNQLLLKADPFSSSVTVIHRADGANYYFLLSDPTPSISATWNNLRPLTIDITSGYLTSANGQNFMGGTSINNLPAWYAGNDGAGSGLDADLLDGLDSSAFAKLADFAGALGDSGWQHLPGGLILQWGTTVISAGANNLQTVNLPRAYPNRQFGVVGSSASVNSTGGAIVPPGGSNSQIQIFANNNGASIFWISLGM